MYIDDGVTLSFHGSRIVHYSHEELCRSIQLQTGTTFPVGTKASSESNVILLQRSVHRSVTLLPIRAWRVVIRRCCDYTGINISRNNTINAQDERYMNTTTHRKNTNTETKIPEHDTQHVTSPRSSRDGLRYGNEKVCEHSRIATSAPPYYPGEEKRATVDSAVSTYRPNFYSGFFDFLSPYFWQFFSFLTFLIFCRIYFFF